jgi:DNA ligase-4
VNNPFAGEPSWSIVVHAAADVERFFKETVENRFLFNS